MVNRFRVVVIGQKALIHGTLDDQETWVRNRIFAHVTEINGAQRQNDLFGKAYAMTWVARVRGTVTADGVAFPKKGVPDDDLEMLPVIQIRKHANRTDIYFARDREVNANELE